MGTVNKYPVNRIVLLGANGQVGNAIYQYLKQHFPDVCISACVRQLPDTANQDYFAFDPFADPWHLLGKADVLINCIGIIRESKTATFKQVHTSLTRCILRNRQQVGNPKIIQISALGANPDSPAPFLSTKGEADDLLLMHDHTVVVRPSIVCTPDTMFAQKLKRLSRISRYLMHYLPFPDHLLQTRIQPILAEDLAAVVAKLCSTNQHPAMIYAVGPEELSLQELISLSDKKISLLPIPKAIADPLIKLLTSVYPGLLNRQQYELLLQTNRADKQVIEKLVGRTLQTTREFWQLG